MTWEDYIEDDLNDGLDEGLCEGCGRETPECVCAEANELEFGDTLIPEVIDETWDPRWGVNPADDIPSDLPGD